MSRFLSRCLRCLQSMTDFYNSPNGKKRFNLVIILLILFILSFICFEFTLLGRLEKSSRNRLAPDPKIKRPAYTIVDHREKSVDFSNIRAVLSVFGYNEVGYEEDWNLFWSWRYLFIQFRDHLLNLKPHQMVNHVPGIRYIISKVHLSTMGLPFMPPAFKMPQDKHKFLNYAAKYPNKFFVQKGIEHGGILIKKPKDFDLQSNQTFVQEFLMNPYLIDGYKFDFSIFIVLTSINPLRVYIYTGDFFFRFCQEKFYPFDPNVIRKYVVGNEYRQIWQVPSLTKYVTRFGGNMRASLDAFMREKGHNPAKIWKQAEEILRNAFLANAQNMSVDWNAFNSRNLFELVRADLSIDTNLRVGLIEINLSPRLYSEYHKLNILNQQVLYNTFNLVGIGSPIKEQRNVTRFRQRLLPATLPKNLVSNIGECSKYNCDQQCYNEECSLCIPCLDENDYDILARAHREHIQRGEMKRIVPKPISDVEKFNLAEETKNLIVRDKWMTKWFYHKCLYDRSWCQ